MNKLKELNEIGITDEEKVRRYGLLLDRYHYHLEYVINNLDKIKNKIPHHLLNSVISTIDCVLSSTSYIESACDVIINKMYQRLEKGYPFDISDIHYVMDHFIREMKVFFFYLECLIVKVLNIKAKRLRVKLKGF